MSGVDVLAVMSCYADEADGTGFGLGDELRDAIAAVEDLIAERNTLLAALKEVRAICTEDGGTFRKRGGTRWGLCSEVSGKALARIGGAA